MKSKLTILGIFFALLGIIFNGVYQNNKYDVEEYEYKHPQKSANSGSPKFSIKIGDKEISYEKKAKPSDEQSITPAPEPDKPKNQKIYRLLGLICGVLALGCAVFHFSLKGNPRVSAAIVSVGLICIAWEYVLYAVGFAVIIIILSSLS